MGLSVHAHFLGRGKYLVLIMRYESFSINCILSILMPKASILITSRGSWKRDASSDDVMQSSGT